MAVTFANQLVVAEIQKNKTDTIRVTTVDINGEPYISLQVITTWSDKGVAASAGKPRGGTIALKRELADQLIAALETAKKAG